LSSESAHSDAKPLAGKVAIVTGAATGIGKGIGRVADFADVAAFIAGDRARWITGQNIRVNGGTVSIC
jgi:NAD(P)-dependent dehydrogenase (short-subunit alcohol dehydrogenase family)